MEPASPSFPARGNLMLYNLVTLAHEYNILTKHVMNNEYS